MEELENIEFVPSEYLAKMAKLDEELKKHMTLLEVFAKLEYHIRDLKIKILTDENND